MKSLFEDLPKPEYTDEFKLYIRHSPVADVKSASYVGSRLSPVLRENGIITYEDLVKAFQASHTMPDGRPSVFDRPQVGKKGIFMLVNKLLKKLDYVHRTRMTALEEELTTKVKPARAELLTRIEELERTIVAMAAKAEQTVDHAVDVGLVARDGAAIEA